MDMLAITGTETVIILANAFPFLCISIQRLFRSRHCFFPLIVIIHLGYDCNKKLNMGHFDKLQILYRYECSLLSSQTLQYFLFLFIALAIYLGVWASIVIMESHLHRFIVNPIVDAIILYSLFLSELPIQKEHWICTL